MSTHKDKKNKNSRNTGDETLSPPNPIALRLKNVRDLFQLTQVDFAKQMGLTNSYISEIEKGKNLSGNVTKLLADTYNISPNWLLLGIGPMFLNGDKKNKNPDAPPKPSPNPNQEDLDRLNWYCQVSPYMKFTILSYFYKVLRSEKEAIEDDIKTNKQIAKLK